MWQIKSPNMALAVALMSATLIQEGALAQANQVLPTLSADLQDSQAPIGLSVIVTQKDLSVRADPSFQIARNTLGLVGGIVERALAGSAGRRDRKETEQLRLAIADVPIGAIAMASTQAAVAKVPWIRVSGDTIQHGMADIDIYRILQAHDGNYIAALSYDYGIDYEYSRVTVFCEMGISRKFSISNNYGTVANDGNAATPPTYRAHSISDFNNLPADKKSRISDLAGSRLPQFKEALNFGFSKCAELLVGQLSDPGFAPRASHAILGKSLTFANRTSPALTQDRAWLIEGAENVSRENFGAFGLKLNYATPGTSGALLYSARGFPIHWRTMKWP